MAYPELAGQLESRGEWQGAMEYWIADDFESGTSWPVYLLDLEPEGVEVSFASSEPPGLAAGDLVRVQGLKIGLRVAASESFIVAPAAETIGCSTTGEQSIAVIMVAYPDEPFPMYRHRKFVKFSSQALKRPSPDSGGRLRMGRHTRRVMSSAGSFFPEPTAAKT